MPGERSLPLAFTASIDPAHRLVGYEVAAKPTVTRQGLRHWRLSLRYAVLPAGIFERALDQRRPREELPKHPDCVWAGVDQGFHDPEATPWVRKLPDGMRVLDRKVRPSVRRSCAVPDLLFRVSGVSPLVEYLNDPLRYHWTDIQALLLAGLTLVVSESEEFPNKIVRGRNLDRLLGFISCVFAAKWLLDLPASDLDPRESGFSYPRDLGPLTVTLNMGAESLAERFELGDIIPQAGCNLPWPTGFNPDDHAAMNVDNELIELYCLYLCGAVLSRALPKLDGMPPGTQQELVDRLMNVTGGFPKPHSAHSVSDIVAVADVSPARALGWVWMDSYSPARLREDLLTSLNTTQLRLENWVVGAAAALKAKRRTEWRALDTVPLLRRFVAVMLERTHGVHWQRDALTPEEQKRVMERWIDNRREGGESGYLELPEIKRLIERHWGKSFEQFFARIAMGAEGNRRWARNDVLGLVGRVIPLRNLVAHRRGELSDENEEIVRRSYGEVEQWLELAQRLPPSSIMPPGPSV